MVKGCELNWSGKMSYKIKTDTEHIKILNTCHKHRANEIENINNNNIVSWIENFYTWTLFKKKICFLWYYQYVFMWM